MPFRVRHRSGAPLKMVCHRGKAEPTMHRFFPDRGGRRGKIGVGEATNRDAAIFRGSIGFREDVTAAVWAEIAPHLALQPARARMDDGAALTLACLAMA